MDEDLVEFCTALDAVIEQQLLSMTPMNVAAVLLSRVAHLTADDAETALLLLSHVTEQMEQIQNSGTKDWL